MSACCFQGYFHKGTPKGSIIKLGPDGRETYVSGPEPAQASGAILIIADVFGISLNNNKIIADKYADKTGARVYLPDFFDGEDCYKTLGGIFPGTEEAAKKGFDMGAFLGKYYPRDLSFPKIDKAAKAIRELHAGKKLGVIGFCWGAPGVMRLGSKDVPEDTRANAVSWAHPTLLEVPQDVSKLEVSGCFLTCENDPRLPKDQRELLEKALIELGKKGIYTNYRFFPRVSHGWSVRGDEGDAYTARAMRDAQETIADFFLVELR